VCNFKVEGGPMRYSNEFKEQIVKEISEVGNVSLVCKNTAPR
jgi:transposase-like protein